MEHVLRELSRIISQIRAMNPWAWVEGRLWYFSYRSFLAFQVLIIVIVLAKYVLKTHENSSASAASQRDEQTIFSSIAGRDI